MRAKMVEQDWVEAVIGLGPNLFYNSPMESCIVICNRKKTTARKGRVIFIDAVNEVTRERAQSFLKPEHQQRMRQFKALFSAYQRNRDLINIGAYQKGSDARVDAAIARWPRIEDFLRQDVREPAGFDVSRAALNALLK